MLCICYGAQSLNVWKGGTLVQNLSGELNHKAGREISEAHPVKIAAESQYFHGFTPILPVNSSHHQAIAVPGDQLKVVATAPDGIIEAVEQQGEHFVLGVQWHPSEHLLKVRVRRTSFASLLRQHAGWKPRPIQESVVL